MSGVSQIEFQKNTIRAYESILSKFCQEFGEKNLDEITLDEVLKFLNKITGGRKQQTKKARFSHLTAFFNFIKNNIDQNFRNPYDTLMMKKLFKAKPSINCSRSKRLQKKMIIYAKIYPGNGYWKEKGRA